MEYAVKDRSAMDEMEDRLRQMVAETCRCKSCSMERQRGLTQIIRLIANLGKLCEATTTDKYDQNQSSVITWINGYLKWRLQNSRIQVQISQKQTVSKTQEEHEPIDLIETLEAPADIPPILETTRDWAQTDPDGELRRIHIKGYPQVTCQVLILQRLPPETSWEELAAQFGLSISTLSSFYRRQCFPRLPQFGKSQGYL